MSNPLLAAVRNAVRGKSAVEDEDQITGEEEETGAMDENEDPSAEDETEETYAEDGDGEPEAEGDEPEAEGDEPDAEDGDEPEMRKAEKRGANRERNRILAILGHTKAESQPALAMKMVMDGTPAKQASALLGSVTGGTSGSLSSRMASRKSNRPGNDAPLASSGGKNTLITTLAARKSALKKG
jgi:hypothetical protein